MLKKITTVALFAAAVGVVAANAYANSFTGRVTAFSPTSISVLDREIVTVGINDATVFTKLITAKPWQADTALTARALRVGSFVAVHVPDNSGFVANWVQIATDLPVAAGNTPVAGVVTPAPFLTEAAKHRAEAAALRAAPNASESKRPGSPGTALHCERLAAALEANTAVVTPNVTPVPGNDEAARHRAEARARRNAPNASESKRPGAPDTALHCERMADKLEKAAK